MKPRVHVNMDHRVTYVVQEYIHRTLEMAPHVDQSLLGEFILTCHDSSNELLRLKSFKIRISA